MCSIRRQYRMAFGTIQLQIWGKVLVNSLPSTVQEKIFKNSSYPTTTCLVYIRTFVTRKFSEKLSLFTWRIIPIDKVTLSGNADFTVGITAPTTTLALMQYRLLALRLVSLYLQQHQFWCSAGYLPSSWHHCTYNNTSSYAVPVTCLTVGITVPTTTLALMQYRLQFLQLSSLYPQQH
jgi:hypothetical protein